MRITVTKQAEDCFDGSLAYNYWFDAHFTREVISGLASLGELDYFPDFPRPFFRLRGKGGFQIKGVEGEDHCQVIFPRAGKEVIQREIADHFNMEAETS